MKWVSDLSEKAHWPSSMLQECHICCSVLHTDMQRATIWEDNASDNTHLIFTISYKTVLFFLIDSEHWSIIMLKVSFQNVSLKKKKKKSKKVFSNVLIDDSLHLSCCQGATVAMPINMQFWELWKCILVVWQIQKALFLLQKLTLLSFCYTFRYSCLIRLIGWQIFLLLNKISLEEKEQISSETWIALSFHNNCLFFNRAELGFIPSTEGGCLIYYIWHFPEEMNIGSLFINL